MTTSDGPTLFVDVHRAQGRGARNDLRSEGVQSYTLVVDNVPQPLLSVDLTPQGLAALGPALRTRLGARLGRRPVRIRTDATEITAVSWSDALFPTPDSAQDVWIEGPSVGDRVLAPSLAVRDLTGKALLDRRHLTALVEQAERRWGAQGQTGVRIEGLGTDIALHVLGSDPAGPLPHGTSALVRVHIGGAPAPLLHHAPLVADILVDTASAAVAFVESFLFASLTDLLSVPRAILAAHRQVLRHGDEVATRLIVPPEWVDARAVRIPPWPGSTCWHQGNAGLYPGRWESDALEILEESSLSSFTLVVGPSQSGRTSYVFGGIFGLGPGAGVDYVHLTDAAALVGIRRTHAKNDRPLALVVEDVSDADPRILALASADWLHSDRVFVVATAEATPSRWSQLIHGQSSRACTLKAPEREAIRHIVSAPAVRAGYSLESGLIEKIVADAMGIPASKRLPALATRLHRLWQRAPGLQLTVAAWGSPSTSDGTHIVAPLTSDTPLDADADPQAEDQLDFWRHVDAFTTLILSTRTHLPLSIGLFGDWGSGKSFFMQSLSHALEDRTRRIRSASPPANEDWHRRVVPIHFNAWHFADADLWASLVHHLFQELSEWLALDEEGLLDVDRKDRATADAHRRERVQLAMMARLRTTQRKVAAAEAAREEVRERLAMQERDRSRLVSRTRTALSAAMEVLLEDASEGAFQDPTTTKEADLKLDPREQEDVDRLVALVGQAHAVNALTGDAKITSARDLSKLGDDLARVTPWRHYFSWMVRGPHLWMRLVFLGAMVFSAYGLHNLVDFLLLQDTLCRLPEGNKDLPAYCGFLAPTTAWVFGFFTTTLGPLTLFWQRVRHVAPDLVAHLPTHQTLTRRLKRFKQLSGRLQRERDRAAQDRASADAAISAAQSQLAEAESDLHDARTGHQLHRFVNNAAGDRYRQHLGLMSTINEDLDNLGAILESIEKDRAAYRRVVHQSDADRLGSSGTGAPRIVLFIDDLDRCPPARVVEVLEAVHLLLAKPLFVVVVAVDARWLLRSVDTHFQSLVDPTAMASTAGRRGPHRTATPRHYLEKIFQVPFQVPAMTTDGYAALMRHITEPSGPSAAAAPLANQATGPREAQNAGSAHAPDPTATDPTASDPTAPDPTAPDPTAPDPTASDPTAPDPTAPDSTAPDSTASAPPHSAPPESTLPAATHVQLTDLEVGVLRALGPIVATPRATKRLVNTARMVRLHGDAIADWDDVCRPAFLLLALEVSAPALWHRIRSVVRQEGWVPTLDALMQQSPEAVHPEAPRLPDVLEALASSSLGGPLSRSPTTWSDAMRLTERFAFITELQPLRAPPS